MARWCAGTTSKSMPTTRPSRCARPWRRRLLGNRASGGRGQEEAPAPGRGFSELEAVFGSVGIFPEYRSKLVIILGDEVDIALVLDLGRLGLQRHVEIGQRLFLVLGLHLLVAL